jgi:hypothetical protein
MIIDASQRYQFGERLSTGSGNLYPVGLKAAIFTAEPRTYLKKCFENSNFTKVMRSNLEDFSGEEAGLAGKRKIIELHRQEAVA